MTRVAIEIARHNETDAAAAVKTLKKIPTDLAKAPYSNVIWDPLRQVINVKGKSLARNILRFICDLPVDMAELTADYAQAHGGHSNALAELQAMKLG